MVIFISMWLVLQVGNAKPEIQKVVDALSSIQTKVIRAVCVDGQPSQLGYVIFLKSKFSFLFLLSLLHI